MGVSYSYDCIEVLSAMQIAEFPAGILFRCDLVFENEHGHKLATASGAIVLLSGSHADIVEGPDDFLPDDASGDDYADWEAVCADGHPGYSVNNQRDLANMITRKLSRGD